MYMSSFIVDFLIYRYGAKQRRLLRESETAETLARRSPAESAAVLRNINTII